MSKLIKDIFDNQINRRIEQVITFGSDEPDQLESEIREYWVTESLESEYEKLLDRIDEAMKEGGNHDCCVWLSGFYGSGKSSFGKYLGFSLDPSRTIGDRHFRELFTSQFEHAAIRQRFNTVANNHEATVVMLDLSNEARAASSATSINNLVFDRVASWAGYAPEVKVAELEFLLEKEGKYDAFKKRVEEEKGRPWADIQSNKMLAKSVASKLAPEFFPEIWESSADFNEITVESTETIRDQIEKMLDLIERRTGSRKVIFVIDELGHYLRDNTPLINPCDGFAKAIKELGKGKAWVIATAQQTLGKDGPFFPLRARFPIDVDLKPSDIREITYRRLLKKSDSGKAALETRFADRQQSLRHATKLTDARAFQGDELSKEDFVNFYPLLPHQFDLIIALLGTLARTTGGVGLRPALKFTQDMLVTQDPARPKRLLADESLGELVTTADIYDNLAKDLEPIRKDVVNIVQKVISTYGADSWEARIAKSIAILQQLEGFPTTIENLAALLYPSIDSEPVTAEIEAAVEKLRFDAMVPIGEVEGRLRFLSEKVSQIRLERDKIQPRTSERDRIRNLVLEEIFEQRPAFMLQGVRKVEAGVGLLMPDGRGSSLVGDKAEIQYLIKFVDPSQIDAEKKILTTESTTAANQNKAYVVAGLDPAIDDLAVDIHRCQEIARRNRNEADKEIRDYVKSESDLAIQQGIRLKEKLQQALQDGWLIFRGQPEAVSNLGSTPTDAFRKRLEKVAEAVFDKYREAAGQVGGGIAEKLLLTKDLSQIASADDPLDLVKRQGAKTEINTGKSALISILDYLDKHGQVDGKRLLDVFGSAPYGWTKDATRYLVAALLIAGKVKLKVGGATTTVAGDTALAGLKANQVFTKTTLFPNTEEIPKEHLSKSAERLVELTGETVTPLPKRIAEAVTKHFPEFQRRYADLGSRLRSLDLPGSERVANLINALTDAMVADGSNAPSILGPETSDLYEDLVWAREVKQALKNGAEDTIRELRELERDIQSLPKTGSCESLKLDTEALRKEIDERLAGGEFHRHITDLNSGLSDLKSASSSAASTFLAEHADQLATRKQTLLESPDIQGIKDDQARSSLTAQIEDLALDLGSGLSAARELPARMMEINSRLSNIEKVSRETREEEKKAEEDAGKEEAFVEVSIPSVIGTTKELDETLSALEATRSEIESGKIVKTVIQN